MAGRATTPIVVDQKAQIVKVEVQVEVQVDVQVEVEVEITTEVRADIVEILVRCCKSMY